MNTLTKNILNIFNEKGQAWLDNLPDIIKELCDYWQLSHITPMTNMTYNYVAKAIAPHQQPVVIKINCDESSFINEKAALTSFNGNAAIKLLDSYPSLNTLLLQQAVPGTSLKYFYPKESESVIRHYAKTLRHLHQQVSPIPQATLHVSEWLKSIDHIPPGYLSADLLNIAINLKNHLLTTTTHDRFLHGDLHHDNMLKNNNDWIVIDPKGIVGELEFEAAAFDFINDSELDTDVKKLFENRVKLFANEAQLNAQRIKDWVFIRLILSAAWSIEDGGDPTWAISLAKKLKPH